MLWLLLVLRLRFKVRLNMMRDENKALEMRWIDRGENILIEVALEADDGITEGQNGMTVSIGESSADILRHTDFLVNMSASADVLAMAKVEVDLASIPEGKNVRSTLLTTTPKY